MIPSRNRNIVIKSQFNINGSRGSDAGKFISEYVSRPSATSSSMAYVNTKNAVDGDGVAFTLESTAISRAETLRLADKVQSFHKEGNRAIQQLVISFDVDYLVEQGIVPEDVVVSKKGDYTDNYDDVRLRHAVRSGLQSLVDYEGYRDGRMVAAIQHDTLHLHVHAVVYENHPKLSRKHGYEERGVIKQSSFNQLAFEIDRRLSMTKLQAIPTQKRLIPEKTESHDNIAISEIVIPDMSPLNIYVQALNKKRRDLAEKERLEKESLEKVSIDEKGMQDDYDSISEALKDLQNQINNYEL